MVYRSNRRRGVVLIAVLVCTMVATALIGIALKTALQGRREATVEQQRAQACLLLQAGIRRAELRIAQGNGTPVVESVASAGEEREQQALAPLEDVWDVSSALAESATGSIQITYSPMSDVDGREPSNQASAEQPVSEEGKNEATDESNGSSINEPMNETHTVHVVVRYAGRGEGHTAVQLSRSYRWTGAELKLLERDQ